MMSKYVKMFLLFMLCFPLPSNSYDILCLFPYPGKSHYMVFDPILQELQARGHNLTVVSFFPSVVEVKKNRRDVDLRDLAPVHVEVIDLKNTDFSFFGLEKYFEHIPIVTDLAKIHLRICEKILDSKQFQEFVDAKGNYDLIIVEHFISDCMLGIIHNYGLPSVGLMSTSLLPWSTRRVGAPDNPAYVPVQVLAVTGNMSFLDRLQNTIFHYFYLLWYEIVIRWEEQKMLEKKLGRKLPRLEDIAKNTSVVLMNTYHVVNGVRTVPPSIVEVGGIHLHNQSLQSLQPALEKWVSEANNGFIIFSLGSLIRGSTLPEKRLCAILKIFARLPQRVIWKWEATLDNIPENVLVTKWLPQYDLLRHKNCVAFITHGGLLSLTEGVSAGVPMLMIPILGDQYGNAAHAEKVGLAKVLRLQNLDEKTLGDALKEVLSKEMRQNAKLYSQIWRDRPSDPMETAIYHIERAVRHKGLDRSSHARWLSTFQLMLLDVLGFVIGVIVAVFLIVRTAYRILRRRPKVKQN